MGIMADKKGLEPGIHKNEVVINPNRTPADTRDDASSFQIRADLFQ